MTTEKIQDSAVPTGAASALSDGFGAVNAVVAGEPVMYVGVYFHGDGTRKFWRITCPCGIVVEYPVNGPPEVDTPHPCGKENHWSVKYR